jgi:peroxiredoxin
MELDGLDCEMMLLSQTSASAETLNRVPLTILDDRIRFCAHPVKYKAISLTIPGVAITPVYDSLTVTSGAEKQLQFLVRKTVGVSGKVLHRDGSPHKGARIFAQIENLSPSGIAPEIDERAYFGVAETNADGNFTIALPPGRARIWIDAEGFVTDRDYTEIDVQFEASNQVPDSVIDRLKPVRGEIVDVNGRAVPGAIVRMREPALLGMQPVVSDAHGKFEIALPGIPIDPESQERRSQLNLAAFVVDQPLIGVTQVNLREIDSLQNVSVVLRPEASADELLGLKDSQWSLANKTKALAERQEAHPAGERGQPAPELDGLAWFNTDARSLYEFRGRYVLLDFWFTGCGPCHGDFPSVKLVHELLEKSGVTVIGVHDNSSTPEAVREICQQEGLSFPVVVDHPDERILNAYSNIGVQGFPSYVLIGPDGCILENDRVTNGLTLRQFKLEVIRKHVLSGRK